MIAEGIEHDVAGPEAANNAAITATLIPLLTLGIPTSNTTAILLGAFAIGAYIATLTFFGLENTQALTALAHLTAEWTGDADLHADLRALPAARDRPAAARRRAS